LFGGQVPWFLIEVLAVAAVILWHQWRAPEPEGREARAADVRGHLRFLFRDRSLLRTVLAVSIGWGLFSFALYVVWSEGTGEYRLFRDALRALRSDWVPTFTFRDPRAFDALPGPIALGGDHASQVGPMVLLIVTLVTAVWVLRQRGWLRGRERLWMSVVCVSAGVGVALYLLLFHLAQRWGPGDDTTWHFVLGIFLWFLILPGALVAPTAICAYVWWRLAGTRPPAPALVRVVARVAVTWAVIMCAMELPYPLWWAIDGDTITVFPYFHEAATALGLLVFPLVWTLLHRPLGPIGAVRALVGMWRSDWRTLALFSARFWAIFVVPQWILPELIRCWDPGLSLLSESLLVVLQSTVRAVMLLLMARACHALLSDKPGLATNEVGEGSVACG